MFTTTRRSATLNLTMEQRLARCVTPLTVNQLLAALTCNGCARISINGIAVILVGMEREDGSGNSFNLTVVKDGKRYTSYVRCLRAA
jgi:hypothetical protein